MKKLFLILAALVAIALPKASQALDVEGFYAGGLGGLNWIQDSGHPKYEFKTGWLAGGFIGYRWCGGFRAEAEATYRHNKVKHLKFHGETFRVGGNLHTWSFMANGYYEIPFCWCITPYVGAGIGYDNTKRSSCNSSSNSNKNKKNGFAWQVMAGGLYPIDECLEMGLEYRFHKGKPEKLYNHAVDLRLNWFF